MRFVMVPPYESGVKMTIFELSWQNGEFLWGKKCSPHFLNQNEELSKKIGACICIYTRVYANTRQGGHIVPPPALNRVKTRGKKWEVNSGSASLSPGDSQLQSLQSSQLHVQYTAWYHNSFWETLIRNRINYYHPPLLLLRSQLLMHLLAHKWNHCRRASYIAIP